MASHQLAIAKAAFAAGLLRPDPVSIPRDEIAHFHVLLHAAITQCSSMNIQNCKRWVMMNILPSTARSTSFGKYLATLSNSCNEQTRSLDSSKSGKRVTSTRRQRLHILYLFNDILHQGSVTNNDASTTSKLQPSLIALFASASEFRDCPKHLQKIGDLLDLWEEIGYYARDYIDKLRETVKQASENILEKNESKSDDLSHASHLVKPTTSKAPFIMPAGHGDQSTPWYDLPAGNMMPHIVPNSTRPINPELIRPLQFVAGPADKTLADAVRVLLEDVDGLFGDDPVSEEESNKDIDELGQIVEVDRATGEKIGGGSYYGWSRIFCEKMRERRSGQESSTVEDRGRRYSSSRSSSHFSGRSRSESSDRSRTRKTKRPKRGHERWISSASRSPTREPSRGRNSRHSPSYSRSVSRSRSRSRSRSPQSGKYQQVQNRSGSPSHQQLRVAAPAASSNFNGAPFHPLPFIPLPNIQFDANGLPIPPPPPPQHQGQWPPPPPSIISSMKDFHSNQHPHRTSGQSHQPWANAQYPTQQPWQPGGTPQTHPPGWSQPLQPPHHVGNGGGPYGWNGTPPHINQQQHINRGRGGYNNHRGGRGGYGGRGW